MFNRFVLRPNLVYLLIWIVSAATGLGDECSEDVQCTEAVANARCHDNACECAENYVEKSGVCHANIGKLIRSQTIINK